MFFWRSLLRQILLPHRLPRAWVLLALVLGPEMVDSMSVVILLLLLVLLARAVLSLDIGG